MPSGTTFVARYLDPLDRLSEFLFGLVMVLSFTLGAGLIIDEGEQATRQMLLAIIGCKLLVALLFLTGWRWARATHSNPWLFGTSFLLAGLGMVLIAIAFGG